MYKCIYIYLKLHREHHSLPVGLPVHALKIAVTAGKAYPTRSSQSAIGVDLMFGNLETKAPRTGKRLPNEATHSPLRAISNFS